MAIIFHLNEALKRCFKNLFNLDSLNDLNFEIIVNFASFLAISFIYRKDIIKLIKDSINYLKTKNYKYENSFKYILLIILACIPAGILGLLFKDKIDLISTNVKYIGIALLITSLALFIVRKIDGKKHDNDITYKDSIIIGLFQGVALLPGISRSGSTLTGGLLRNIKKEEITALKEDKEPLYTNEKTEIEDIASAINDALKEEPITLTNFEEDQEKTAIISIDELMKKAKDLELISEEDEDTGVNFLEKYNLEPAEVDISSNVKSNTEEKQVKAFKVSQVISPIYGVKKEVINDNDRKA